MYLTKYWIGRWWWYVHTSKKHKLKQLKLGKFWIGRVSYKSVEEISSMEMITAEQFEREYAARNRLTVDELRAMGRVVKRCLCGDALCEGWQSISQRSVDDDEADYREYGGRKPDWID